MYDQIREVIAICFFTILLRSLYGKEVCKMCALKLCAVIPLRNPIEDPKSGLSVTLVRGAGRMPWQTRLGNCSQGAQGAKKKKGPALSVRLLPGVPLAYDFPLKFELE